MNFAEQENDADLIEHYMWWSFCKIENFLTKSMGRLIFTIQDQDYFNGLVQPQCDTNRVTSFLPWPIGLG